MTSTFIHEQEHRGREAMEALGEAFVVILGVGSLGSNLAENLVRQGVRRIYLVDNDRIEPHNINQNFTERDIGSYKVNAEEHRLYEIDSMLSIMRFTHRVTDENIAKLTRRPADWRSAPMIWVDTFDNSVSRGLVKEFCEQYHIECLHVGMADGFGEVKWNEEYIVPEDVVGPDVCDYPLARNLILGTVAIASEVLVNYITKDVKVNYHIYFNRIIGVDPVIYMKVR